MHNEYIHTHDEYSSEFALMSILFSEFKNIGFRGLGRLYCEESRCQFFPFFFWGGTGA